MKKFKILLGAVAMIAALALVGCSNGNDDSNETPADNGGGQPTVTVRAWERAIEDGADLTDNGDGTATATFTSNYNGTAVVVYINEDKTAVASGTKVKVDFDYETVEGKWSDDSLNPKFKVQLASGGDKYYNTTKAQSDNEYYDVETKSGSFSQTFTASAEANELVIQFNAYNWAGGSDVDDQIKVTIKSVTIVE